MRPVFLLLICCLLQSNVFAQFCTNPGQTPATAFPVCGNSVFQQNTVPLCDTKPIYVPGCEGTAADYSGKNPYWYKFTCFAAGTLAFTITPNADNDDYDWQLFDITGRNPDDVFTTDPATAKAITVASNWAGTYGKTGASINGVGNYQCASDPVNNVPTFSKMPTLIVGHTYLLLVSHFLDTQSGYGLSFSGGTAVITDTTPPRLKAAYVECSHTQINIKLNKRMSCASLAANGSDFILNSSVAAVKSATGANCNGGFDMDSLTVTFDNELPPGNYTISVKKGTDANTLLDICETPIPEGNNLNFTVYPKVPTQMDSLGKLSCAPQTISVFFDHKILCNTVKADGSDFTVTGTYPVTVLSAKAINCDANGAAPQIDVTLSQPLQTTGNFTIVLNNDLNGNIIIDECGMVVPPSSLPFSVKDTVSAAFTYVVGWGCQRDSVQFFQPGTNGINQWKWNLDENQSSTSQNPRGLYSVFSAKNIQCIVNNGFCSDTSSQTVLLDNFLKADFDVALDNCPLDPIQFKDKAVGKNITRNWSFGDNTGDADSSPIHVYSRVLTTTVFTVRYTITDQYGCTSTAEKPINLYATCIIEVPNAFTPNGDGKNDMLYPLNAVKAINLDFKVYNRWGQLLYSTTNWKRGWDGTFSGQLQQPGMYVWVLSYDDRDSKKHFFKKGTVMLMR
ncbi:gliding motility-associated C-terminal domain-containing protein [Chitinophagaceae bacterium 26-R-25]|nr:gliding motility-associated C-terminal domain-containing protein [Chitinophagaceae bacterium 26-R-25]